MELIFGIYTPEGDAIALSTGIMVHVHTMSSFIKYLIENDYENDPGIKEGDIFVTNETWSGGVHTADILTVIPIFHEGQLIGWAGGVTHELEVGAHEHGSMTIFAPERFSEGHHVSAEKVGENDKFYKHYMLRLKYATRMPNELILDEKARLAGCILIREEVKKIIEEFGFEYYIQAIREVIEDGRREFISRLKERLVPGRYRGYVHLATPFKDIPYIHPIARRDTFIHSPIEVNIQREGRIRLSFEGASKWGYFPYNCTPSAMDGGLWIATVQLLSYDGKVNDGSHLCVEQELPKGSVVNTDFPFAATSITWGFLIPAYAVYGMLISIGLFSRGYLEEVFLPSAGNSLMNFGGVDIQGEIGAFSVFEMAANQSGARAILDGIDCGYAIWNPEADQGNAELYEYLGPILWVNRRFIPDAHGYGMYRGGNGWASLWLISGALRYTLSCYGHGVKTGYIKGLFGGYPGPAWFSIKISGLDISDLIKEFGHIPTSISEIQRLYRKYPNNVEISRTALWADLKNGDIVGLFYTGGTGYGDPLDRDPQLVKEDYINGVISLETAEKVYGVVIEREGGEWTVNYDETRRLRDEKRRERLDRGVPVKNWWLEERERILKKELPEPIKEAYNQSLELSERFKEEFTEFWNLPREFRF
jgi:N-methylhydantoinase B/oxoprolinase/acetone carboxylase alpha subunit